MMMSIVTYLMGPMTATTRSSVMGRKLRKLRPTAKILKMGSIVQNSESSSGWVMKSVERITNGAMIRCIQLGKMFLIPSYLFP